MIKFDRFPEGRRKCVTMSYDDGVKTDERLIEIFDKYGIKGTFNLNSGLLGKENVLPADKIKEIYKNHEVAVHGAMHRSLTKLPLHNIIDEIMEDRKCLEGICGYPVRGMSYANGLYSDKVCNTLHTCGIIYARTAENIGGWEIPENFLKWHPTCHHNSALSMVDDFLNWDFQSGFLFYVWGHSFEFDRDNNWDIMDLLCKKLSANDDIWYATNIEIYNYITALRSLIISADNKIVINPTAYSLWFSDEDKTIKINAGETLYLSSSISQI